MSLQIVVIFECFALVSSVLNWIYLKQLVVLYNFNRTTLRNEQSSSLCPFIFYKEDKSVVNTAAVELLAKRSLPKRLAAF